MEYVTEERVREIIREELGRRVVNISSPTITVESGIDIDEVLKKIAARLNVDLSSGKSHSKEVIGSLYALADHRKMTEEDIKVMTDTANTPSSIPFTKATITIEANTAIQTLTEINNLLKDTDVKLNSIGCRLNEAISNLKNSVTGSIQQ